MAKATMDQLGELVQQIRNETLDRERVQAIIEGRFTVQQGTGTSRETLEDSIAHLAPATAGAETAATPTGDFASEEVASTRGYQQGWQLKPPMEQARLLAQHFRSLDISHVERLASGMQAPPGFDGIGVVPKLSFLAARDDKREHCDWPVINRALVAFLPVIKAARRDFRNYMEGNIGPDHLRLFNGAAGVHEALNAATSGDCLVLPVQTGIRHRGKSPRRARVCMTQNEFGLDPVTMGCIILTHPERLQDGGGLWIDCPGAEYAPDAVGGFTSVPYWHWSDGELRLDWFWVSHAGEYYGSASAVRPGVLPSNLESSTPSSTGRSGARKQIPPTDDDSGGLIEF